LLTENAVYTSGTFVEVPTKEGPSPKKPELRAKGATNVTAPSGARADIWSLGSESFINLDNITATARPGGPEQKRMGQGVSMGQMNELKLGLGQPNDLFAPPANTATAPPRGMGGPARPPADPNNPFA